MGVYRPKTSPNSRSSTACTGENSGTNGLAPLNGEITLSDARICDLVPPDLSHHLSLIHDDATIGHGLDQGEILLDDDDRQSFVSQPTNDFGDPLHDVGLDAFRRFVEQDEAGTADEDSADGQLLLLAAAH